MRPTPASMRAALPGAEALFVWHAEREELETAWPAAGDLRWIQTASAGVDGLLFPDLVDSDVVVTNARGVFDEPIAEWVIGSMLAFATGLHRSIVDQQAGVWGHDRSTERLEGKHLTVVGPGPIGRATGQPRARPGDEREPGGPERAPRRGVRDGDRDRAASPRRSAPPTTCSTPCRSRRTTPTLFDAAAFAAMKPSARFINVGRGTTVDEPALIDALQRGVDRRGGARRVRDRTAPGRAARCGRCRTVIVSPHISGDVKGWERAVVHLFTDNAARWVAGRAIGQPGRQARGPRHVLTDSRVACRSRHADLA